MNRFESPSVTIRLFLDFTKRSRTTSSSLIFWRATAGGCQDLSLSRNRNDNIACGDDHTIVMRANGSLMASGNNDKCQLGLGDTKDRRQFTEITNIPKDVVGVVCGHRHTIIMRTDGSLMATGCNDNGQLGFGDKLGRQQFTEIT